MSEIRDWIDTVAGLATAIGVVVASWQLFVSKAQTVTAFEDSLAQEYRKLCQNLPIEALLGGAISDDTLEQNLPEFFHYFTLTNDQIFMRRKGRVRRSTWIDWAAGIEQNLQKPAFASAWYRINVRSDASFDELRSFLAKGKDADPKRWKQ